LDTPWDSIRMVGIEKTGVKDRMYLHTRGKVEFEGHFAFANDVEDLEWTEALVVEFRRRASGRNVSPRQPDKISSGKWGCFLDVDIVIFLVFGLPSGAVDE
jgi:hypothetical protein